MRGPAVLWIVGLVGLLYIVVHHAIDLDNVKDIFIGQYKINFLFAVCDGIATSAITAFIIGAVYEYVIKVKQDKEFEELLDSNNRELITKIPSIITTFDTFWNSLSPQQLNEHLFDILVRITKNDKISLQFVKAVSSVEGVSTGMWNNLHHNITVDLYPDDKNILYLKNTISFQEKRSFSAGSHKVYFVMADDNVIINNMRSNGLNIEHYWTSFVGFQLVKKLVENGSGEEYGYLDVKLKPMDNSDKISNINFQREKQTEAQYKGNVLVWSLSYNVLQDFVGVIDNMYTISTFTGGKNPFFYIFLSRASSSLHVNVHSKSSKINIFPPKIFLRPDQEPIVSTSANESIVIVNDVLLPGHGVLFLFNID